MEKKESIIKNTYRYKFSDTFNDELYNFSKIHQYDERKDFKQAWNTFVSVKIDTIEKEIKRLEDIGYSGDILDKMFKSARYYFRKKTITPKSKSLKVGTTPLEVGEKRNYQTVTRDLLETIDKHIQLHISQADYKPSTYFNKFCNENIDIIKAEMLYLSKNGYTDINDIKNKIKKTYKNRYYIIR